jgi:ubiquinone/menaquinone biosynthesis C-methylase UbiE
MAVEALSLSAQAALYNSLSDMQFKDASLLIEEILKPQLGESILDLGCGTGRAAMVLASRVGPSGRILGIDLDKRRVEVAMKTLAESEVKHVTFKHSSCADAVSEGPFDAIFSNYVLHWIQDQASIVQDAYKCLRSGGRFVFLTVADCPPIFKAMMKGLVGSEDVESVLGQKYGKVDYWTKICTEAGFKVEFMEEMAAPHYFPNPMSVLHLVSATVPTNTITLPIHNPEKEEVEQWLKPFTDEKTGQIYVGQPVVRSLVRKP